jgi:hypothetical protein
MSVSRGDMGIYRVKLTKLNRKPKCFDLFVGLFPYNHVDMVIKPAVDMLAHCCFVPPKR